MEYNVPLHISIVHFIPFSVLNDDTLLQVQMMNCMLG